jgi:hypothetical protein
MAPHLSDQCYQASLAELQPTPLPLTINFSVAGHYSVKKQFLKGGREEGSDAKPMAPARKILFFMWIILLSLMAVFSPAEITDMMQLYSTRSETVMDAVRWRG